MMVAIFDAFNGAGGDMIVASMLGVSLTEEDLKTIIQNLSINISFKVKEVQLNSITAKKLDVMEKRRGRTFKEVLSIIDSSDLDDDLKRESKAIFERVAIAEGAIHGRDYKKAVFHEVGSDDAIFDVVAATTGILRLKKKGYRFFATTARLGSGFIRANHGKLPVPAPATLEILRNSKIEVILGGEGELLTPTAAAILAHFCEGKPDFPFYVKSTSYSAGKKSLFRLILAEAKACDSIALLETTVDDASGEILGNAIERISAQAYDVNTVQVIGKKGRPAVLIRAISKLEDAEEIAKVIMKETGSTGVRIFPVYHRVVAEREEEVRDVEIDGVKFRVRVKMSYPETPVVKPEFEDVKAIANRLNMPLQAVYREVLRRI